ncbi:hypothetical protein H2203_004390 [Taxawa tesnikishii (nom. ined.)]|nr:hypothetical protein H2203_004390 [Dothideales sp. JES 119]
MKNFITLSLLPFFAAALPQAADYDTSTPVFSAEVWHKYHCLTVDKFEALIPKCSWACEDLALRHGLDGCSPNDFKCHCSHSQRFSDIIEPCIFPGQSVNATCSVEELRGGVQPVVTELCNFFNATGYADYLGCSPRLTWEIAMAKLRGN